MHCCPMCSLELTQLFGTDLWASGCAAEPEVPVCRASSTVTWPGVQTSDSMPFYLQRNAKNDVGTSELH